MAIQLFITLVTAIHLHKYLTTVEPFGRLLNKRPCYLRIEQLYYCLCNLNAYICLYICMCVFNVSTISRAFSIWILVVKASIQTLLACISERNCFLWYFFTKFISLFLGNLQIYLLNLLGILSSYNVWIYFTHYLMCSLKEYILFLLRAAICLDFLGLVDLLYSSLFDTLDFFCPVNTWNCLFFWACSKIVLETLSFYSSLLNTSLFSAFTRKFFQALTCINLKDISTFVDIFISCTLFPGFKSSLIWQECYIKYKRQRKLNATNTH